MAVDRGTDSDAVRAELDEWVHQLNDTVERLYAEIERIRRGDLKPLEPREGEDAAD